MRSLLFCCLLMILWARAAESQTKVNLRNQGRNVDFGEAEFTRPVQVGGVLPASCSLGELFYLTTAVTGKNLYACTAQNVWTLQNTELDVPAIAGQNGKYLSTTGSALQWSAPPAGTTTVLSNGNTVGTSAAVDLSAGPGLTASLALGSQAVSIQYEVDSAAIPSKSFLQSGQLQLCVSSGAGAPNYLCSLNPILSQYSSGMLLQWRPGASAAGPVTLNIDGLGARPVKMSDGVSDPAAGELQAGWQYQLWYDGSVFRMMHDGRRAASNVSYCESAGASTMAYSCSLSPALPAYQAGLLLLWRPDVSTNGGAVTMDVNGLGARALRRANGTDYLRAGDVTAGRVYPIWYDGEKFRMVEAPVPVFGVTALCASTGSSATAFSCSVNPPAMAYEDGMVIFWRPNVEPAGGAMTLSLDGMAAQAIKRADGSSNPQAGELLAGRVYPLMYDGTVFRLLHPGVAGPGLTEYCESTGGSGSAFTCNVAYPLRAWEVGFTLNWRLTASGDGGATTLSVNALAPVAVKLADGVSDPQAEDLRAGNVYRLYYDGAVLRLMDSRNSFTGALAERPLCNAARRGRMWFSTGGVNEADTLSVCAKDAANDYGWRSLYE